MTLVLAILNTIIAIPQIAGYVETLCAGIASWYIQRQTSETLAAIANAADAAASASTDAERYAAAQLWQTALSKPRVTAS